MELKGRRSRTERQGAERIDLRTGKKETERKRLHVCVIIFKKRVGIERIHYQGSSNQIVSTPQLLFIKADTI